MPTAREKPTPLGNLKEGVLVYPYLCELWLNDWYYPSFTLLAWGTEPVHGSPREAGGTNVNSGSAIGIMECGGEASAHAKADASALQRLGVRSPLPHRVGEGQGG